MKRRGILRIDTMLAFGAGVLILERFNRELMNKRNVYTLHTWCPRPSMIGDQLKDLNGKNVPSRNTKSCTARMIEAMM